MIKLPMLFPIKSNKDERKKIVKECEMLKKMIEKARSNKNNITSPIIFDHFELIK